MKRKMHHVKRLPNQKARICPTEEARTLAIRLATRALAMGTLASRTLASRTLTSRTLASRALASRALATRSVGGDVSLPYTLASSQ
jgi:hypothetical protein